MTFTVVLFFKETKQVSLEDVDLLLGERALGTLPDDMHKAPIAVRGTPTSSDLQTQALPVGGDGNPATSHAETEAPSCVE